LPRRIPLMTGLKLHRFDLELCFHVFDNISTYMDSPAFASFVEEAVDPPVVTYLKALDGDAEPRPMLLSDGELRDLVGVFDDEEFQHDRDWVPNAGLYRRSLDCFAEICEVLAKPYAEEWAGLSAQFAERLEARGVWLHHGIEVVREWVGEIRRLLRAMGATNFLPAPEGAFPTPTNPHPIPAASLTAGHGTSGADMNPEHPPRPDSSAALGAVLERLAVALEAGRGAGGLSAQPAPEALSKEDAARFIGVDVPAIEYLIRTRKLEYVQYGSQRGRVIPVASLRKFLEENRQATAEDLFKKRPR
jgi:hypothetical protein